jgi:hypothetical protein
MGLRDDDLFTLRTWLRIVENGIREFASGPNADPQFLEDLEAYRFRDDCRAEIARREAQRDRTRTRDRLRFGGRTG